MKGVCFSFLFFFLINNRAQSQYIEYVQSYYSNSFRDWRFYDKTDKEQGNLTCRWNGSNDFSAWDFRIGENSGFIRLKWREKSDEWEFRMGAEYYTITPVWREQFDRWRVSNNDEIWEINSFQELDDIHWNLIKQDTTMMRLENTYRNNPGDWTISKIRNGTPMSLGIILIFICTYYSTPAEK